MMKTTIKLLALAFVLFATACSNDDEYDMLNSLWRNVTQNEARIDDLEKWCVQANTNITSLQTIVNVLESNGMVTSITPVMEGGVEIGYTITFSNHDPITIYHGKDGKDGQNGANGQNGTSPIVGVAKYTDGVYYWTLNGEWLLDENGNKLRVSGEDGQDGENGQNGTNGTNGQNGITPQLKIEADYWYVSYDNGNTWTQLGKAKGEDGENGQNGAKGDKGDTGDKGDKGDKGDTGDSMFQSVTQDADNVYFTLADGTVITIAKGGSGADQPNSDFLFTITYMPNGGEGEVIKDTVFYADSYTIKHFSYTKENYFFAVWNTSPNGDGFDFENETVIKSLTRNIVLYAKWQKCYDPQWVDLGLPSGLKWGTCNVGALSPEKSGIKFSWGETAPKQSYTQSNYKSVGYPNPLPLDKDAAFTVLGGSWRMPTNIEFEELRTNCTWTWANMNGVEGYNVEGPNGNSFFWPVTDSSGNGAYWTGSSYASVAPLYIVFTKNKISLDYVNVKAYTGRYVRGVCE